MSTTKTRAFLRRSPADDREEARPEESVNVRPFSASRIVELAFWGTIFWGVFRLTAHFLNFTPYGVGAFARPFLGVTNEDTWSAIFLGAILLFFESLLAIFVYSLLFRRTRVWWSGLLYGLMLLVVAGFFFRIGNWDQATLSTELFWYLSYGLFVGMTVTLEQSDEA